MAAYKKTKFTVCTRNMQTKLTIDNRWHRQHYSVAVIDNRVHRFVLNDGKVLLKMALILKKLDHLQLHKSNLAQIKVHGFSNMGGNSLKFKEILRNQ